jgi:tripartite-type tricarboxylate transporter receptor subunit TctC
MPMFRKLGAVLCACLSLIVANPATHAADGWPQKTIKLMHGFGAGGNADSISRLLAAALAEQLGTVIVDAKPGAGGNLASDMVSRATPDGHTLILLTGGHAVSAALYKKLKFDPIESFAFVSLVGTFPFVVATRADSPITDLAGLIATAKNQPSKLSFRARCF